DCHYLVSDLEEYSHRIQRALSVAEYRLPIVAGVGAGATMAYAALAQAPAATLSGAASLDMSPALTTPLKLCEGAPATTAEGGGFAYGPAASLPGWWRLGFTAAMPPALKDLAARVPQAETVALPPGTGTADGLTALVVPKLGAPPAAAGGATADLPLAPLAAPPGTARTPLMAIIISGDGGWRDLDKTIGQWLAGHGVPTVGFDSLLFFWRKKTPEAVARALERVVDDYGARWHARKVALVGYSFGADVLPAAYNRLRADVKARVVQISLLGFSLHAAFQIEVTGWLGFQPGAGAPSTVAEAKQIDPALIQCFYGEEEDDTACLDPALARAELVRTKGGHHFDGDYPGLARKILEGAERRGGLR
ncbi:MAG: virulence factor family protein, partial [Rhodospirillaceae bacterium]|nr:virulence factor family protein [Rhodospirillaceae bacterium]